MSSQYLLSDALQHLTARRLLPALQTLHGTAIMLKNGEIAELIQRAEDDYRLMLNYLTRGVEDPERSALYQRLFQAALLWHSELSRAALLQYEPDALFAATHKTLHAADCGTPSRTAFLSEKIMRKDVSLQDLSTVFDALWTAPLLNKEFCEQMEEWMQETGNKDSVFVKCVAVSALTLSSMQFFDIFKWKLLLRLATHDNPRLRVRALFGWMCSTLLHADKLSFFPKELAACRELLTDSRFSEETEALQTALLLTLETTRIEKDLRENIIPEMMKHSKQFRTDRSLGLDELDSQIAEIEMNPDWNDESQSKLKEKMKHFLDLQGRGADLYMGSFKMLKTRFPFFHQAVNWFVPFTESHPDISSAVMDNPLVQMMLRGAGLCDSDKYSICLMSEKLGNSLPNGMTQKLGERLQMGDLPIPEEKDRTFEEELRSYLQSFYRFSQIFIHREDFVNPFKLNLLLADCDALKPWNEDCTRLRKWADYTFHFKNYVMALALYDRIPSADRDAEILMHRAFCLESMHQPEKARDAYAEARRLAPKSSWALDRWANCCRQTGAYEEAFALYSELEKEQPEDAAVAMKQAECLLRLQREAEALPFLFKAEWLKPDVLLTHRAIAWCSLLLGKYDQAEKYYQKILETPKHSSTDWLNAGHTALLTGRIEEAVTRYKKAVEQKSNAAGKNDTTKATASTPYEFLTEDEPLLLRAGISPELLHMVTDCVLS
ncbi:MAG: tetratricopeptide repeat protein [Alloprevotella sp.]